MSDLTPISELMQTDPLKLSDQDLDRIIAELRSQRARFIMADDKTIGKPESRKSPAQKKREANAKVMPDGVIDDMFSDL